MRRVVEIAVALDLPEPADALALVDRIGGSGHLYKVGFELFVRGGPAIVHDLRRRGHRVFLDLKLHDIPNTVGGAARAAVDLGVELLTVHASGGRRMITAAREAVGDSGTEILAVTVLTSLSAGELSESWARPGADPGEEVLRLAEMAIGAGAHGVVASPIEVGRLRERLGSEPRLVTPGIRLPGERSDDQVRIAGPTEAVRSGADLLVVGRPITRAGDPLGALERFRAAVGAGARSGATT